jgi:phosphatidate phosphatase APP1
MSDWSERLDSLTRDIRKDVRDTARAVRAIFKDEPYEVLAYRGYGNNHRAFITGRVVERRGIGASTDGDSTLTNLLNTYRRVDSDPAPFADLSIEYQAITSAMKADDEGFFSGWVETPDAKATDEEWVAYDASLIAPKPPNTDAVKTSGEVLVPPMSARLCVISDIDDTVIQSGVSNFLQAAKTVILGNARTRLPFPGVSAFYEALRNGAAGDENNPVFYVSSSPWNIYDVITEFMDIQKMPKGPLLLRDWDIGFSALSSSHHFEHKRVAIGNIMRLYPNLKFILIGDSSQHDPEIYRQAVKDFPHRVAAIYIREVDHDAERSAAITRLAEEVIASHSTLVLCENTLDAARHAVEHGWIRADALPGIGEEKRADEGRDDTKVAAPDGGAPRDGAPPVVIDADSKPESHE